MFGRQGGEPADLDEPQRLKGFFDVLRELKDADLVLAYHDVSDGGVLITLLEMAFASRCGLGVDFGVVDDPIAAAFAEELGAVLQVRAADQAAVDSILAAHGFGEHARRVAAPAADGEIEIRANGANGSTTPRASQLHRRWSETSFRMQALRDNPSLRAPGVRRGCWMPTIPDCTCA